MKASNEEQGLFSRVVGGVWRSIDSIRRLVVNLVFLVVIVVMVAVLLSGGAPDVPDTAALVLDPHGRIVEQARGDGLSRVVDEMRGTAEPQALLADLIDAVHAARDDERIAVLVIDCDRLSGAGLTKLEDLAAAIQGFKTSGKKVIAVGDDLSQAGYFLAAQADEILLHPYGSVMLPGFGRYRRFYKEGIDRLGIEWNIFRVGRFKSAVEPFMLSGMSDESREADMDWLGDLWGQYLSEVAAARGMEVAQLESYITGYRQRLREVGGDTGRAALEAGLVDGLTDHVQARQRLIAMVGEDGDSGTFNQIGYEGYLEALGDDRPHRDGSEVVGVIVAVGPIVGGTQPPGTIGAESTAALIRDARVDDAVKAVVLRIDSGGGSAFASEVIRNEVARLREAGKPVVVSMGSVAASGGYWIATSSDEIWAAPTTITGSIGIYGMYPTFERPMAEYLGIRVDGVGTTWMSGAMRQDRAMSPEVKEAVQLMIEDGYQRFLSRVAEARGMTPEQVDAIGQGRVWSGQDALDNGLVDKLGSLDDAIASAAELAGLGQGYGVRTIEEKLGLRDRLVRDILARVASGLEEVGVRVPASPLSGVIADLERQAGELARLDDPRGIYAYCMESYEIQ
jgi:protease-4